MVLLARKGKIRQRDLDRLILTSAVKLEDLRAQWSESLAKAKTFVRSRPPSEAGCLYIDPRSGKFFTPAPEDSYTLRHAQSGGILPRMGGAEKSPLRESSHECEELQQFFGKHC
jgi:hypothetical protein